MDRRVALMCHQSIIVRDGFSCSTKHAWRKQVVREEEKARALRELTSLLIETAFKVSEA